MSQHNVRRDRVRIEDILRSNERVPISLQTPYCIPRVSSRKVGIYDPCLLQYNNNDY